MALSLRPLEHPLAPVVLAVLTLACQGPKVEVSQPPGPAPERGGGSGAGGSSSGPGAGATGGQSGGMGNQPVPPPLVLPDAGPAPATPPADEKCAEVSHGSKQVPVDLVLLMDTSGSMNQAAGMRTKWELVRDGLVAFLADPKSAGLGVGLQFFPSDPPGKACAMDSECGLGGIFNFNYCQRRGVCAAAGMAIGKMTACLQGRGPACPMGTTCQPLHRCAVSGMPCLELGQPCGAAGDMCQARAGSCSGAAVDGCDVGRYAQLAAPVVELPAGNPGLTLSIVSARPEGGTPMLQAVQGALQAVKAHAAAHTDRKAILVLATDGLPMGCVDNTVETVAAAIDAAAAAALSTQTFVIGVFSPIELTRSQPALERLAMAGRTGMPFVLTAGDDLTQRFLMALEQIRGTALACEFLIPKPMTGTLDFGKVNVRVTTAAGPQDLVYVESPDRCDPARGGWHYDVNPKMGVPTRVILCDSSCKAIKGDMAASVDLRLGCTTKVD